MKKAMAARWAQACVLVLTLAAAPGTLFGAEPATFRVGAAKVDSTPPYELCTGGYGIFCGWKADSARPNAIGGTDRLYTRALVIESEGRRLAIVTTSAIGLFAAYKPVLDPQTKRLITQPGLYDTRLRIARETGLASDYVFIQSDHSHRAPDTIGIWGGVPPGYLQELQEDMLQAVKQALSRMAEAELYVGAIDGKAVSCPSRYPIAPGGEMAPLPRCRVDSLYSFAPNEWVDDEFRILEARAPGTGARIASFANYSTHATVLDDTGSGVFSGDWTGWLAAMLDDDATGAIGLATVGTLGRTDFESGNNVGDGDARNLNRERAARARLQFFLDTLRTATAPIDGVKPFAPVAGSGILSQEIFLREANVNPIFYGNYAPLVGVPSPDGAYPSETEARIDRAITTPWLSGNTLGTFAGAFRIGQVFFATAPGEEFPNAQKCLRDGCVTGEGMSGKVVAGAERPAPQMHFFLGATNDFLGYMGPAATYDQVVAQGATYFFCPPGDFERQGREGLNPVTQAAGYEAGRLFDEGSCPDHFILMSSPGIGDHVNCAIQNAARALGFGIEGRDPACDALTAADQVGAPPVAATGAEPDGSGQEGVIGMITAFVADAIEVVTAAFSGSAQILLGELQQAVTGALDDLAGVLLDDDDASVAAAARHVAEDPQGDGAGTLDDLVRDAGRLLMGHAAEAGIRAGVGVVDMTPDVGYCAGQYCDSTNLFDGLGGDEIDPFATHKTKRSSYGVQSRLTARAIVVEGSNGKRVALLKTDNYLAQDALMRRVGQILQREGSSIGYEQILHSATHNHSSSYSSTPSWGVWVFEDVFDPRFFEHQARRIATAIRIAERDLKPARMGATTVRHKIYKGNVVRLATAADGTPAGYPLEYGDLGLVVMRFDELTDAGPRPLAAWVNWGEHPESLDAYDLHTADFVGALERFVDRELGAPLVFSQGDVGSAEAEGDKTQLIADDGSVCGHWPEGAPAPAANDCPPGQGVLRVFEHAGYVQFERNVRFLADSVKQAWALIGAGGPAVQVPLSSDFPVDYRNYWAPGPLSHPYPAVSNCSTEPSARGDVGVPVVGLPDCGRFGFPGENELTGQAGVIYATMKAEGVPVPDHYGFTGFSGVEENLRIYLQAFRLGEVLLASCACEAQVDLILNLETRTDQVADNIYNGFDWACYADTDGDRVLDRDRVEDPLCRNQFEYYSAQEFPTPYHGSFADEAAIARMRAQVHNDARGWDAPENVLHANTEPADASRIWGNFTREELPPERGYKLPVGLGHAGDYVGYTVSYREYMNRDHYRKALTAYGPHTADYMVTRLTRMAGAMRGGPELLPEPHDALAQADEARQLAQSTALGASTQAAYEAWLAAVPLDVGPAEKRAEPQDVTHFAAATFRWRGGNTQIDNPEARVEHRCDARRNYLAFQQPALQARCDAAGDGAWVAFADMTGEVQTRVHWPLGLPGVFATYTGQFAWEWTASFEAYRAFPARLGSTPLGDYRFVVEGCINDGAEDPAGNAQGRLTGPLPLPPADRCLGGSRAYDLVSNTFAVTPRATDVLPRSYASPFPFVEDKPDSEDRDGRICETCTFRPWAFGRFGPLDADADGDGIDDTIDLCPATPMGAAVDAGGCAAVQRDGDGDGVNDALDQCPATPAGTAVDTEGCPLASDGTLTVQLSATPASGDVTNAPLAVDFAADAVSTHPNSGALSYVYYYGDGTHSGLTSSPTSRHEYDKAGTYVARVVVVDRKGRSAEDEVTIVTTTTVVVDPDPVVVEARLTVQLSGSRAPVTAMFDGSGSTAPDGAIYRFDFGDGSAVQEGTDAFATRTYAVAGRYTVTLTVTDPADAANTDAATAVIEVGSGQATTAQLVVSPSTARVGERVTFDARASIAAEGTSIVSFRFQFGDGSEVTRTVAEHGAQAGITTHAYGRAGTFQPTVTVVDSGQTQHTIAAQTKVLPVQAAEPARGGGGGGALGAWLLLPLLAAAAWRGRSRRAGLRPSAGPRA